MKRFIYNLMIIMGVFTVSSCDLDLLDNPNAVTISSSDINFLLNRVQTDFAGFYSGTSGRGQRVTRILHQASDTYEISHAAVQQNGSWFTAYANILNDIKVIKEQAAASNFRRHAGIAKTIEAMVWLTLVDTFGDVPFSEALDPQNFNPKLDTGASVYQAALALLTSAKEDFTVATTLGTPNDFYYARNYARWTKLVNTLLLKYHLNLRLINKAGSTTAISALIAENNMLGTGDDFLWRYGRSTNDPDSRHPAYAGQFPNGGGDYQSNFFMWHLTEAKGFDDPRASYYFYRQVSVNSTVGSEIRCIDEFPPLHYPQDMVFCLPGTRGYWGRDHLDPQGIPPDNLKRTLYGVYPAGLPYDNNAPAAMSATNVGNGGAGIQPIMLAAYVDFMLAEAALELGTAGDPKTLMVSGASKHINFVRTFALSTGEAAKITAHVSNADFATSVTRYTNKIAADYDAATDAKGRLRVIAREYWISLYGSGMEAYNLYRRTGQPDNMQLGQIANFGNFPRSFIYPANVVEANKNIDQKAGIHTVKVFWDNNPDGFIN